MEVTPLGLRGMLVSSGDGATPHGRDPSASRTSNDDRSSTTAAGGAPTNHDPPVDEPVQHLAGLLKMADSTLTPDVAQRLARLALYRAAAPDLGSAVPGATGGEDASRPTAQSDLGNPGTPVHEHQPAGATPPRWEEPRTEGSQTTMRAGTGSGPGSGAVDVKA